MGHKRPNGLDQNNEEFGPPDEALGTKNGGGDATCDPLGSAKEGNLLVSIGPQDMRLWSQREGLGHSRGGPQLLKEAFGLSNGGFGP